MAMSAKKTTEKTKTTNNTEITTPKIKKETKEEIKAEIEALVKEDAEKEDTQKYKIGSIVFVAKDVEADLAGFKLFPQYKKYAYTVEAYDGPTGVYVLRRLNLSLKLKEADIVAPNERHDSSLIKSQY